MNADKLGAIVICIGSAFTLMTCGDDELRIPACVKKTFPMNKQFVAGDHDITLKWEPSEGASGYDVFIGAGGEEPVLFAKGLKEREINFPAELNKSYSWFVEAHNANGERSECMAFKYSFETRALPDFDTQKLPVNVLVVCYDPIVGQSNRLHNAFSWGDPRVLAAEYIDDIRYSSHGLVNYNIVEWKDVDEFPEKVGGFKYTFDTYAACYYQSSPCRSPDDLDYRKMFADFDIVNGINNDVYDEVWIFGAPYFGFWESSMAGYGAFYINGDVFPDVPAKTFAIMGFSYERGTGEMLHNLCHRTEATMSRQYGGWQAEKLTTSWARFAANQKQSGVAAVGTCHYPPNAQVDYDYCNQIKVSSSADDWYNYPYLTGAETTVNANTWGMADCQRSYLRWWFHHLPYRIGDGPDGSKNNWWRYIFELP